MTVPVTATIHFVDSSRLVLRWDRRKESDPKSVSDGIRQALETNQFACTVGGDLMVIPLRAVKYVLISPAPPSLPASVIAGATIVTDTDDDDDEPEILY